MQEKEKQHTYYALQEGDILPDEYLVVSTRKHLSSIEIRR
jgi:hypothetical protein